MTFEAWLIKQKERNDRIGDLARDFIGARDFDKKVHGIKVQKCDEEHLMRWMAPPCVFETLEAAEKEYADRTACG